MTKKKSKPLVGDSLTGFVNGLSGLGGYDAKGSYGSWNYTPMDTRTLSNMYRSNWLARQIIDAPVGDMIREGWSWEGNDADQMADFERDTGLVDKLRKGAIRARLYGGSAIVVDDGSEKPADEIKEGADIKPTLVSCDQITPLELIRDPFDPDYESPRAYSITAEASGGITEIHRSRVMRIIGLELSDPLLELGTRWGDSVLDNVLVAVNNATRGSIAIANLLEEAAVDVFGIPDLSNLVSDQKGEDALIKRVRLAKVTKSITHAMILDAEEAKNYTQKQINFSNLPETQRLFLEEVCGASNIPMTRLMGQQAKGLGNDNAGDLKNYYNFIRSLQDSMFTPVLTRLAKIKGYDARPVYKRLDQLTEKEQAEVGKLKAEKLKILSEGGEIPADVSFEIARKDFSETPEIAEIYENLGDMTDG